MDQHDDQSNLEEPYVLSFEAYRQANQHPDPQPDNQPPEPTNETDPKRADAYWAGRNLAMRRSARWAA